MVSQVSKSRLAAPGTPEDLESQHARTAFGSIDDAFRALTGPALRWFDIRRDYESALSLLQQKDWELFWIFPMMRGYGASASSRRLVYIAHLMHLLGNRLEFQDYVRRAEAAIHAWYPEHLHSRYDAWIGQVKARLFSLSEVE